MNGVMNKAAVIASQAIVSTVDCLETWKRDHDDVMQVGRLEDALGFLNVLLGLIFEMLHKQFPTKLSVMGARSSEFQNLLDICYRLNNASDKVLSMIEAIKRQDYEVSGSEKFHQLHLRFLSLVAILEISREDVRMAFETGLQNTCAVGFNADGHFVTDAGKNLADSGIDTENVVAGFADADAGRYRPFIHTLKNR
jgi:hypothetical protein